MTAKDVVPSNAVELRTDRKLAPLFDQQQKEAEQMRWQGMKLHPLMLWIADHW